MDVIRTDNAISIENLHVEYLSFERSRFFSIGEFKSINALNDINISIKKGELVAILGKNGAGKTTLLRAISGELMPKKGKIITSGRVFTLRGANPGLIPYLTARENVNMLTPVYGVSKDDREDFMKSIEDFCELGDAFDRKYKSLSSGMAGRVGFGFTTNLSPEILLMDETLGVGDEDFRKKAAKRAGKFMERGETLLLSTHSLNLAKNMCNRGLVLDQGNLLYDGEIGKAVDFYLNLYD